MARHTVVTPCYNDWKSLNKLLSELNKIKKKSRSKLDIFIMNDYSNLKFNIKKNKYKNIKSINIINLKRNVGSQKAIFIGLQYIKKQNFSSTITIMDSDGEDDPVKVAKLINLSQKFKKHIIVAERSQRTEKVHFKFLNYLRLILTFLVTGKYLNFGNFSSFHSSILKKILVNSNLSMAYSAGVAKNYIHFKKYPIKKKKRFFGFSKVSFNFLLEHSVNIISVFKNEVALRSFIFLIICFYLFKLKIFIIIFLCIFLFNIMIFINYIRHINLKLSLDEIKEVKKL